MAKENKQREIVAIITKLNPQISVGEAAKVYKILKRLGEKKDV